LHLIHVRTNDTIRKVEKGTIVAGSTWMTTDKNSYHAL